MSTATFEFLSREVLGKVCLHRSFGLLDSWQSPRSAVGGDYRLLVQPRERDQLGLDVLGGIEFHKRHPRLDRPEDNVAIVAS